MNRVRRYSLFIFLVGTFVAAGLLGATAGAGAISPGAPTGDGLRRIRRRMGFPDVVPVGVLVTLLEPSSPRATAIAIPPKDTNTLHSTCSLKKTYTREAHLELGDADPTNEIHKPWSLVQSKAQHIRCHRFDQKMHT